MTARNPPRARVENRLKKPIFEETKISPSVYLNRLSLLNFKNIEEAQIDFSPRINCFVGDNGTGKTNLLDAIHYLSMCKSAFNLTDLQCTRHGTDAFMVNGVYTARDGRNENIVCSCSKGHPKKLCRGGKEYDKLSDHIGVIPIVMVTPSDTALINESGEERRKYLNSLISQLDREYLATLIKYNRVLAERNKLLKNQSAPNFEDILSVFNLQLASLGTAIHQRRARLIEELAPVVARYYAILSDDREEVALHYRSELNDTPFEELLRKTDQRDRINMFTTSGIHRDDIRMSIGGYPLRKYGSQGQQKSFLVALKLAQYDLVAAQGKHRPILLLDDIFDKLDLARVGRLIGLVSEERFSQIFITDCNDVRLEGILKSNQCDYTLFQVRQGQVSNAAAPPNNASATETATDTTPDTHESPEA